MCETVKNKQNKKKHSSCPQSSAVRPVWVNGRGEACIAIHTVHVRPKQ